MLYQHDYAKQFYANSIAPILIYLKSYLEKTRERQLIYNNLQTNNC